MNCDQVFDVLTRGPFPTGTSCDEPVEAHLNECPECRRLAEALRPALELFQETVDPEESRDLPGYWSGIAGEKQQAAVSYARQVEPRAAATRTGRALGRLTHDLSALTAWRMAAMLALGVTLGMLLGARMTLERLGWSPAGPDASVAPLVPHEERPRTGLAERMKLAVLPACRASNSDDGWDDGPRGERLLASVDLASLNCCSGCHHAASDAVPGAATARVAQSCQLCHNEQPSPRLVPAP
jgi:hypothetical protein